MKLTITIHMDNRLFEGYPQPEVARILRRVTKRIAAHQNFVPGVDLALYNLDTNLVGNAIVTGD